VRINKTATIVIFLVFVIVGVVSLFSLSNRMQFGFSSLLQRTTKLLQLDNLQKNQTIKRGQITFSLDTKQEQNASSSAYVISVTVIPSNSALFISGIEYDLSIRFPDAKSPISSFFWSKSMNMLPEVASNNWTTVRNTLSIDEKSKTVEGGLTIINLTNTGDKLDVRLPVSSITMPVSSKIGKPLVSFTAQPKVSLKNGEKVQVVVEMHSGSSN